MRPVILLSMSSADLNATKKKDHLSLFFNIVAKIVHIKNIILTFQMSYCGGKLTKTI